MGVPHRPSASNRGIPAMAASADAVYDSLINRGVIRSLVVQRSRVHEDVQQGSIAVLCVPTMVFAFDCGHCRFWKLVPMSRSLAGPNCRRAGRGVGAGQQRRAQKAGQLWRRIRRSRGAQKVGRVTNRSNTSPSAVDYRARNFNTPRMTTSALASALRKPMARGQRSPLVVIPIRRAN